MKWEVRLCGSLRVAREGRELEPLLPGRQGRTLLAYLVLRRRGSTPRAELVDAVWGERPPAAADAALSALLSKLRAALGPGVLEGRSALRLVIDDAFVDVERAAADADAAEAALAGGDAATAATRSRGALAVTQAPLLPEVDSDWVEEHRRELELVRLRALEALATALLRRGGAELGAAEQAAREAVALAPYRESSHRLLMEVLEAAGNPAEALRVHDELRLRLRDELGTPPGPSVRAVHDRLLRGRPRPVRPAPPQLGPGRFVGREAELAALARAWEGARGRRVVVGGPRREPGRFA